MAFSYAQPWLAKSLIGNEVTYSRKLREALLARRIEAAFTCDAATPAAVPARPANAA